MCNYAEGLVLVTEIRKRLSVKKKKIGTEKFNVKIN